MRFYKKQNATHVLTISKVHQCLIEMFKYSDRYPYIWIETKNAIIYCRVIVEIPRFNPNCQTFREYISVMF